jgi:hypothetical protein
MRYHILYNEDPDPHQDVLDPEQLSFWIGTESLQHWQTTESL